MLLRFIAAAVLLFASLPAMADQVVQSWSGSGMLISRPITFSGPWEMQWQADGFLQILLQNAEGEMLGAIANQAVRGPGSSYVPKAGTYIIQFSALAPWKAQAVLVGK